MCIYLYSIRSLISELIDGCLSYISVNNDGLFEKSITNIFSFVLLKMSKNPEYRAKRWDWISTQSVVCLVRTGHLRYTATFYSLNYLAWKSKDPAVTAWTTCLDVVNRFNPVATCLG